MLFNKKQRLLNPVAPIGIDVVNKFFGTLTIKGWVRTDIAIDDVRVTGGLIIFSNFWLDEKHHLGDDFKGFLVQAAMAEQSFPDEFFLDVTTKNGVWRYVASDVVGGTSKHYPSNELAEEFSRYVRSTPQCRMLDIGGRARSGLLRKDEFGEADVTVLDIIDDDGVDVVADAHGLAGHFQPDSFDAVLCVSVFEHLIMPWQVVVQLNKVMKTGAVACIHTHQTIGMHDIPWDYYRFSDTSWKGLFNKHTGFEIIKVAMQDLMFILPFVYADRYRHAESSAGFEGATCLVRKIGATSLDWPLVAESVTSDMYPDCPDGGIVSLDDRR